MSVDSENPEDDLIFDDDEFLADEPAVEWRSRQVLGRLFVLDSRPNLSHDGPRRVDDPRPGVPLRQGCERP